MKDIFKKIYEEEFSEEKLREALNTDAQKNFEVFVESNMSDEMIDETIDGFIDFFLKEKAVYSNIQEYYADQGEVSWEPIEGIVEEEWEARQEQKAESEEFSAYRYRL